MVVVIEVLELLKDEAIGVFCLHEKKDIRCVQFLEILKALDCFGIPQPKTVPAEYS